MKKILIFTLFIANLATASEIDSFQFMSEEFPPYNYSSNGIATGSSVETFQLLLKELKSTKSIKDLTFWPWARSYGLISTSPNHLLFVVTRTEAREKNFKWVGPISNSSNVLIGKKDFKFSQNSKELFYNYRYCVVRDDAGGQILKEKFQIPTKSIFETSEPNICVQLIKNNRADLFAYDLNVTKWILKKHNEDFEQFESKLVLSESEHYIAFSRQTSDELISKIQSALDKVKKSKDFKSIKEKYFKK